MIAIIGDVHGCYHTLKQLFENIQAKYPGIETYAVGDLVDRGRYSRDVINFVKDFDIRFTLGNHDLMFLQYFSEPSSDLARTWDFNGGSQTVSSYREDDTLLAEHLRFIASAPLFFNFDDVFISHAGVSADFEEELKPNGIVRFDLFQPFFESRLLYDNGILWNRSELMNLGKLQVVGHTRKLNILPVKKNNSVYIDTSVYTRHKLSAVVVEEGKIQDILSVPTNSMDLSFML